ncbi:hypothetical protein RCL_jg588.t1 [Rhizophagus clarus]|uniref:Uncharacterized protein n=1 Tax=Rhizophagus clarus TaxID=94130 RepID=A0A8H3QQP0_9GLOM|nr:hypothetical protein RCL_jg588.t1 [Rhizophagus clarus]
MKLQYLSFIGIFGFDLPNNMFLYLQKRISMMTFLLLDIKYRCLQQTSLKMLHSKVKVAFKGLEGGSGAIYYQERC